MKKYIIPLFALVLAFGGVCANPVSQQTAQANALRFVSSNFESSRQSSILELVYTGRAERGEATFFVFNVGNKGFVIMSADDNSRPVLGYSDEGVFDPENMAPATRDFLQAMSRGISYRSQQTKASVSVVSDWAMLENYGRLASRNGGRANDYLVETKWNQSYPYNYFCPLDEAGPGGRAYSGCVAAAASQQMRYWNHPVQGEGQRCYTHDTYGQLCANFGETTYDWEHMPVSISANSPQEEIDAVALLQYHVGVSMEMGYGPSGSGAVTNYLCERMPMYFHYTNNMVSLKREDYSHEEFVDMMKASFDMSWPLVCAGGGHAYVCDGYDDFDMIHFNWGWGGSSDGWFDIDEHDYIDGYRGLFNYVPEAVYEATPSYASDLVAEPLSDIELAARVSWKNPTATLTNSPLSKIDQIVVMRDNEVIYTEDNVTPGAEMSFIDDQVPCFNYYHYAVYAVCDGQRGKSLLSEGVNFGPSCNWKIVMQSSGFQGWCGGYVSLFNNAGVEIQRFTINSSTPSSITFPVPVGNVSFAWTAPSQNVNSITIAIRDSENNMVFNYSGASSEMDAGIFLEANNGCGHSGVCSAPIDLVAQVEGDDVTLTWQTDEAPLYGFNIYRDGELHRTVLEGNIFVDHGIGQGCCYVAKALCENGESESSNESCASPEGCQAPRNFDFEILSNNYKVKLLWEAPGNSEGLTGYFIYRKPEGGEYERIKLANASSTSYTDNIHDEGHYYYRICAFYNATDCTSSPAAWKYDDNQFYLHVYYSPTEVDENNAVGVEIYPNPVRDSFTIRTEGLLEVSVYNVLGQMVRDRMSDAEVMTIELGDLEAGIYLVKVITVNGEVSKRIHVIR